MILAVVLAALLLLFLFVRRHAGVSFLAMIAGVAIYDNFGEAFSTAINQWLPSISIALASQILYVLFVAVFPLLLYLRAGRSGLFGPLRILESSAFALLLTALLADHLTQLFTFDTLARGITSWISGVRQILLIVGIIFAYIDTLFFRPNKFV